MSMNEELQLNRICVSLEAENKGRRRTALEDIRKFIDERNLSEEELFEIWNTIHRQVVRLLNDNVEGCRDSTINILKSFLEVLPVDDKNLIYVIPILTRRLASQELIESSEEVRLNAVSLLRIIIRNYKNHLSAYMDDVVAILAKTVTDSYPNVKKESCEGIAELATLTTKDFYSRSEKLIKPILSNFTHQHYKVRVASVKAIGVAVQCGNNKTIEDVATPMAERLFDQSSAVRAAVIEVAGQWFLDLRDRYSWWHKLIPLLLTGLHDEIELIRNRASELWDSAGKKYLVENESDEKLKDKMDYLTNDLEHYPSNIKRSNLGCRVIAQQNMCKLVGGIVRELEDWMADIKVRSAQLLCVLVLNIEEHVTQHIEKLLPAMYRACNDEDKRVVQNIELAAEYMGYFVPPDIYYHLVVPTLEETPTSGHLRVFAAILSTSQKKALLPKLEKIGDFLQQSHICQSRKVSYQEQMLHCCESLISVCGENCSSIAQDLFTVIFTVLSMTTEEMIQKEAKRLLEALVLVEKLDNLEELFSCHLRPLLMNIRPTCQSWTMHSEEFKIFQTCLNKASRASANNSDLVLPILTETTSNDADPEVRLKQFFLLSDFLIRRDESLRSMENLTEFVDEILEKTIMQGLVWSAGRAAEVIRTAAVACLCALLNDTEIGETGIVANKAGTEGKEGECEVSSGNMEEEQVRLFPDADRFSYIFEKIMPILVTLVDDNAKKTRLYSLKAIWLLMEVGQKLECVTEEHIHKTYPVILKRLDDGADFVRCAAVEALSQVWKSTPKNYDLEFNRGHVDHLYTTAIVHLDDPDENFQKLILDALMELGKVNPELLAMKLEKCKLNFRNQKGMEQLLKRLYELLGRRS
ncbi:dynein assembly factor 5, axonemal [Orussus abietinus]|uniref:dynein assembly factor 5, axonemal n=1 Tax=Orussus abietinus TaxID=222816 RepID=UPI00062561AB|nr:dynein assembly factor 5, axonemal [Orussus abietinus]